MKIFYALIVMLITTTQLAFAAVNLNTATQAELETVKGIGPAKAKMIINDRTKNGRYKSLNDLDRVKGFGQKSIEKLRGEISVNGTTRIEPAAIQGKNSLTKKTVKAANKIKKQTTVTSGTPATAH